MRWFHKTPEGEACQPGLNWTWGRGSKPRLIFCFVFGRIWRNLYIRLRPAYDNNDSYGRIGWGLFIDTYSFIDEPLFEGDKFVAYTTARTPTRHWIDWAR